MPKDANQAIQSEYHSYKQIGPRYVLSGCLFKQTCIFFVGTFFRTLSFIGLVMQLIN